jgi:hypothetical protein
MRFYLSCLLSVGGDPPGVWVYICPGHRTSAWRCNSSDVSELLLQAHGPGVKDINRRVRFPRPGPSRKRQVASAGAQAEKKI